MHYVSTIIQPHKDRECNGQETLKHDLNLLTDKTLSQLLNVEFKLKELVKPYDTHPRIGTE